MFEMFVDNVWPCQSCNRYLAVVVEKSPEDCLLDITACPDCVEWVKRFLFTLREVLNEDDANV